MKVTRTVEEDGENRLWKRLEPEQGRNQESGKNGCMIQLQPASGILSRQLTIQIRGVLLVVQFEVMWPLSLACGGLGTLTDTAS